MEMSEAGDLSEKKRAAMPDAADAKTDLIDIKSVSQLHGNGSDPVWLHAK